MIDPRARIACRYKSPRPADEHENEKISDETRTQLI